MWLPLCDRLQSPMMDFVLLIKFGLIVQKKKTSLNSGQILWKWSHCFFHFRERRARFSKTIFLQLIFSALSPLLIFRLIYFQLFWSCSLYLTCILWSIAIPTMEIDLLIKTWNSLDKNLNSGQNSLKMKSLPLSFPRKKNLLIKKENEFCKQMFYNSNFCRLVTPFTENCT